MSKIVKAIGLMSGTSMDGVDVALLETDGERIARIGGASVRPYSDAERELLREALKAAVELTDRHDRSGVLGAAENMVTNVHAEAVEQFLRAEGIDHRDIGVVGFHGQTVLHRPDEGLTVQLGDGELLADLLSLDVVCDFRANDVAAGGQGAPFVPAYHRALVEKTKLPRPAAVINIGGVANISWIGEDGRLLAFDTGPGNALIDDWMRAQTGKSYDHNGETAAKGTADRKILEALLNDSYFLKKPPKSLDRGDFNISAVEGLSLADGAATLTAFTAASLVCAIAHFPAAPKFYAICGGGAHNETLLKTLRQLLPGGIKRAEELGWSADAVEAQAFAFLAVRSLNGLPITYPGTTGVAEPLTGGVLVQPVNPFESEFDNSFA